MIGVVAFVLLAGWLLLMYEVGGLGDADDQTVCVRTPTGELQEVALGDVREGQSVMNCGPRRLGQRGPEFRSHPRAPLSGGFPARCWCGLHTA